MGLVGLGSIEALNGLDEKWGSISVVADALFKAVLTDLYKFAIVTYVCYVYTSGCCCYYMSYLTSYIFGISPIH